MLPNEVRWTTPLRVVSLLAVLAVPIDPRTSIGRTSETRPVSPSDSDAEPGTRLLKRTVAFEVLTSGRSRPLSEASAVAGATPKRTFDAAL